MRISWSLGCAISSSPDDASSGVVERVINGLSEFRLRRRCGSATDSQAPQAGSWKGGVMGKGKGYRRWLLSRADGELKLGQS